MKVLIVDDHEVVREGLTASLAADEDIEVVGSVANAKDALQCAKRLLPDVAIVDLRLPDIRGDELCRKLSERFPSMGLVVLSSYANEEVVRRALDGGASAYVTKAAGLPALRAALGEVKLGNLKRTPGDAQRIMEDLHRLAGERMTERVGTTPQQQRVLELAADGLTYHQIGEKLYITESTVRFHIQNLKAKFGTRSKTELIAKAIRMGKISLTLSPSAEPDPDPEI